ncbi:hypothetical protein O6H91_18G049100 [Diphasiastrum complanatum]|uniref:Uncharacterized protein n=1 Tax=Diphasiastrum complanatum TaxID=34168 RepID=A0ACC2B0S1_DIPCM|nr:hypothetical protein O6H91_18G049100 [Diphasiastrum complanatum]
MAAAARLPHSLGVAAAAAAASSSSSEAAASSAQNGRPFSDSAKHGIHPSLGFLSRAKDLCRNASLAVSTFVGAPLKRVLQRPPDEYESRRFPWISAQSASNGSSSNSSAGIFDSKKVDSANAITDDLQEAPPVVPGTSLKTTALMSDVSNLIKLVNSRDIVELELKHKDYELLIRKKEALPAPPAPPLPQFFPGPHVMAHTPFPTMPHESIPLSTAPSPPAPPIEETKVVAPVAPKHESPPMLSPMAGTLYRSPAPGEPAFVKVGDKVQKGQVVCIVEAMKLMNEIEADQSGTIVEILAEDGKAVSIDTPLYIIKP